MAQEVLRRRVGDALVCGLFALAIAVPGLVMIARSESPTTLRTENRRAAARPAAPRTWNSALEYPAAFAAWWSDVFGAREELLHCRALIDWFVFGRSPAPLFFRGKDDWLFYAGDDSRNCWRGLRKLPASRMEAWSKALEARRDALKSIGVEYLYAIVPSKQTIYREHLPASEVCSGPTPLEQLLPWLDAHCSAPVLDLRPALLSEKEHDRPDLGDFTFHRLGSHWSSRGAWAACRAITAKLSERFPSMRAPLRSDFACTLREEPDRDDDLGVRLNLDGEIAEPSYAFSPIAGVRARVVRASDEPVPSTMEFESDVAGGEVMLLDHDSFGPEFRPQLAEQASRLVCIWRFALPVEEILLLRPRIVVQAITERFLIYDPIGTGLFAPHLDRARFDRLPRARPDLDEAAMLRSVESRGGTAIRLEDGAGETVLSIRTSVGKEAVRLPEMTVTGGARLALRIVLTSPKRSAMSLWFRHRGEGRYDYQNRAVVEVGEGRSDVCFVVPVDDLAGALLLRPGLDPGEYELHVVDGRLLAQ
jgi:hypothetical protein